MEKQNDKKKHGNSDDTQISRPDLRFASRENSEPTQNGAGATPNTLQIGIKGRKPFFARIQKGGDGSILGVRFTLIFSCITDCFRSSVWILFIIFSSNVNTNLSLIVSRCSSTPFQSSMYERLSLCLAAAGFWDCLPFPFPLTLSRLLAASLAWSVFFSMRTASSH